jgi:hypothetical protein
MITAVETIPDVKPDRKKGKQAGPRIDKVSREARKLAAAILEVLAGERTPMDAAEALGISQPRYYTLELRALNGLLAACEPRKGKRTRSPKKEIETLQGEVVKLRQECVRKQALVRAAQRTVGLSAGQSAKQKPTGRKRRRAKPKARALRVVSMLRKDDGAATGAGTGDGKAE